jgi:hypothetical protein
MGNFFLVKVLHERKYVIRMKPLPNVQCPVYGCKLKPSIRQKATDLPHQHGPLVEIERCTGVPWENRNNCEGPCEFLPNE